MELTDNSLMPCGKFKNHRMEDVPASYLLWIYDNNKCSVDVREYIEDNIDVLYKEINEKI